MSRIKYDTIVFYQDKWKKSKIPEKQLELLIETTNLLMHRAIENNHSLDNIELLCPEDCDDYYVFRNIATAFNAFISIREDGSYRMHGFGNNKSGIDVE